MGEALEAIADVLTTIELALRRSETRFDVAQGGLGNAESLLYVIRSGLEAQEASKQYAAVRAHLPADLQVAAAIAYTFGWRMQSEILTRERRHVDLDAGTLRLDPGETKNGEGRVVYLTPELKLLLAAQLGRVDALQKKLGRIIPYLFPFLSGMKARRPASARLPEGVGRSVQGGRRRGAHPPRFPENSLA